MNRLFSLLLWLVYLLMGQAQAVNHAVEFAYFQDIPGQMTLADIQKADFKPYTNTLRLGYVRGNTWIRVVVKPDPNGHLELNQDAAWVLRVGPHYLDHVDLYQQRGGQAVVTYSGDLAPGNHHQCADDLFCFSGSMSKGESQTLYLQVNTDGLRWIQTQLINGEELNKQVIDRVTRISSAISISMALLLLGLLFAMLEPTKLMQTYCVFQLSAFLFTFASTGLMGRAFPQLDPHWVNALGQLFQVLRIAMTILLSWAVLKNYDISPMHRRLNAGMLSVCAMSMLLILVGQAHLALIASYVVFFLNPAIQIYGVFKVKNMDYVLKKIVLLGYVTYAAMVGFGTMVAFAVFSDYTQEASFASVADWRLNGMFVSMFVFWVVLKQQQINKLKQWDELQNLRLIGLQTQFNTQQLQERKSLIDMLTHELKNPLGTIRFALESIKRGSPPQVGIEAPVQHIQQSVVRMDALIEHVAQSNQVDTDHALPVETMDLGELIDEFIAECADPHVFVFTKMEGISLRTNRQMLGIVIENLLSNAYKYASDRRVMVQVEKEFADPTDRQASSDLLVLRVINHVSEENMPDETKLFDRYYRHPNVMGISGLGIGLSLVQSAVARMGGTVSSAIQNHQVCFTVRIPDNMRKTV